MSEELKIYLVSIFTTFIISFVFGVYVNRFKERK
jgi:hypothetical protein